MEKKVKDQQSIPEVIGNLNLDVTINFLSFLFGQVLCIRQVVLHWPQKLWFPFSRYGEVELMKIATCRWSSLPPRLLSREIQPQRSQTAKSELENQNEMTVAEDEISNLFYLFPILAGFALNVTPVEYLLRVPD